MSDYTAVLDDLLALSSELVEIGDEFAEIAPDDAAIKAGARHSAGDQGMIQDIYDAAMGICELAERLGADAGEGDEEESDAEAADETDEGMPDEMKAVAADPVAYAYQECNGIQQGTAALSMLAQLAASEAAEQDDDTPAILAKLRQAMQIVTDFIDGEIGEIKAIEKRDDANPKEGVNKYGADAMFADAKNKKYPLGEGGELDEGKVRAAWNYINKPDNAAKYEADEVEQIKARIVAAWKKAIDKAGPPSADATKKSVDASSLKGIEFANVDGEEIAVLPGYSVKAMGNTGLVSGHLIKYGGDGDLSQWKDIFTKSDTDYGRHTKTDVWVHHRMLPGLGKRRLTNQAEIGFDDEGVFIKHLLDLRNSYESKLYGLVQDGKLGWSSGTAPHLVERKSLGDGRHEVSQWILGVDASYTPSPAGGLVVNAGAMKSLFDGTGLDLLNTLYEEEGTTKAVDIELALIAIEAEYTALAELDMTLV